jgi:transcriptional regulator with XRE-family HTH domain
MKRGVLLDQLAVSLGMSTGRLKQLRKGGPSPTPSLAHALRIQEVAGIKVEDWV